MTRRRDMRDADALFVHARQFVLPPIRGIPLPWRGEGELDGKAFFSHL